MPSAKSDVAIINAKPQPITIEIPKTSVIVVDMQNDFGSKGGMFDRAGGSIFPTFKLRFLRPQGASRSISFRLTGFYR
jgi:hypothetical protein